MRAQINKRFDLEEFAYLEWQQMPLDLEIVPAKGTEGIPKASSLLGLSRNDAYELQGELSGLIKGRPEPMPERVASSLDQPLTIRGRGDDGYQYEIKAYLNSWPPFKGPFTIQLSHPEVLRTAPGGETLPIGWLTEWYLNGPHNQVYFPRVTKRVTEHVLTKERADWRFIEPSSRAQSSGPDHAFVQYGDQAFLVQQVAREYGPTWSRNLAIEYRPEWGGIPSRDDRVAIAEIIGFVMGRQLLNVGYTSYSPEGGVLSQFASSPNNVQTRSLCEADEPLVLKLDPRMGGKNVEAVLQVLVPVYLEMRKQLPLSDALWRFTLSRQSPLGVDLPMVASALQGISKVYMKQNNVARRYLDKKAFAALLEPELDAIEAKLRDEAPAVPDQDRTVMMNKMRGAWSAGSDNEALRLFFRAIGIAVGDFENAAIQQRNLMDHGGPAMPKDLELGIRYRIAYHVLFQRVVLKMLGYDSTYVDLATPGCPEHYIGEPQVGAQLITDPGN